MTIEERSLVQWVRTLVVLLVISWVGGTFVVLDMKGDQADRRREHVMLTAAIDSVVKSDHGQIVRLIEVNKALIARVLAAEADHK